MSRASTRACLLQVIAQGVVPRCAGSVERAAGYRVDARAPRTRALACVRARPMHPSVAPRPGFWPVEPHTAPRAPPPCMSRRVVPWPGRSRPGPGMRAVASGCPGHFTKHLDGGVRGGTFESVGLRKSNLSGPPHGPCDPLRPSNDLFSAPWPWTSTSGWFPRLQSPGPIGLSPVGHFRPIIGPRNR
jgi:hypothetical protein